MKTVKAPIFATPLTASALEWNSVQPHVVEFAAGTGLQVGDFRVQSFSIPHDARDPVGFTITCGNTKVSVATDLGYVPDKREMELAGEPVHSARIEPLPGNAESRPLPLAPETENSVSQGPPCQMRAASDYIATELPDETERRSCSAI